jgi:putative transposase
MTSKPVALLMADLGVTKAYSRPHVSNDNPFLGSPVQDAEVSAGVPRAVRLNAGCAAHCDAFFSWYIPSTITPASAC